MEYSAGDNKMKRRALEVLQADRLDAYRVLVEFSDGTMAAFTVEELVALRPRRTSLGSSLE